MYVYQGTAAQAPMFVDRLDPDAIAVADPDAELYRVFGVERGGWRAMFGLRSWLAGLRATLRGHRIGRKLGDPWTLPLVVAVADRRVVWEHRGTFAGDHPGPPDRIGEPMTERPLTIVAVHGNGGGSTRFARLPEHLPDGIRFEAIDLPGFNGAPDDPGLRSVPAYADRLADLLDQIADADVDPGSSGGSGDGPGGGGGAPPVRPVVLGHGIGGSIALDLASRRPETMAGLLLHAPVGADLDRRLFPRLMSTAPVRSLVRRLISARPLRPIWRRAFFPIGAPAADLDTFFDGYRTCEAFGRMFEIIDVDWFTALEPVTAVPTVLLWGENDRVLRSGQSDAIAAKAPGARTVIQPGWDHFPMLEQPEEYARVVADLATGLVAGRR